MKRSGFSMIELMVVIVILGLLSVLIVPNVIGQSEQAKRKLACVQMKNFVQSIETFKLDNNDYPSTEQGLAALVNNPDADRYKNYLFGGYIKSVPKDPWGSDYIYLNNDGEIEIVSSGADRKEGGEDQNRDIKLSECETMLSR
jgi:general secretion pathway protein G